MGDGGTQLETTLLTKEAAMSDTETRGDPNKRIFEDEDTEEVPINAQARSIVMWAAKLRMEAKEAAGAVREAMLLRADELEADALRMAFES